ncbi:MAG: peptide/nickel transport system substrate-binding protein, partial [Chloroflexota bacterium]|nr:peptide/nickel transport system substrate-binding protein [Chloroflexota bacterium]
IERVITRYDYDPRKSQQLMEEAGFAKGADGFFVRDGTRFQVGVWASSGAKNEKENAVIVGSLHKSGFDATTHVFSAAQLADAQARALIPGLGTRGIATRPLSANISAAIPRAENRWTGENRGGWANPLYDRAFEGFSRALDRNERIQHNAELEQVYTQELPSIPHWFSPSITAYTSQLSGPVARLTPDSTTAIHHIHEWEWRS